MPGNIGALLRTADAAGMDAVILVDTALDIYNPNVIRSSTGACFLDNIYRLSSDEALAYFNRPPVFQLSPPMSAAAHACTMLTFARNRSSRWEAKTAV